MKEVYGLPQAGILANSLLVKILIKSGYYQFQFTPGLWHHVWQRIAFVLVVDEFGIKALGDVHANHLVSTLKKDYEVMVDCKGQLFVGIHLEWYYKKLTLDTHIPGFVPSAFHKYQHKTPAKPQHAPEKASPIQYGAKFQTTAHNTLPRISSERICCIQEVVGIFAWYSRVVDTTMA